MGISLGSLLEIQGNETSVGAYSNKERTGWGFIVYLMREGEIHTEIVSTLPHTPYATKEEAQTAGDALVNMVKKMDLTSQRAEVRKMMGPQLSEDTAEVIRKSREPNPNL